mgnify:CR=1 FL=1
MLIFRALTHPRVGFHDGCQDAQTILVGLGDEANVDSVTVAFPGGATVTDGPFDGDQRLWLYEDGAVEVGWASAN